MGFLLFLLVTATLLVRPSEQIPELRSVRIYETLILLCLAFSLTSLLEQFSLRNLESRPITIGVFGFFVAAVLSQLAQGDLDKAGQFGLDFAKVVVYYLLLVGNVTTAGRMRVFIGSLVVLILLSVGLSVLQYHEALPRPEPEPAPTVDGRPQGTEQQKGAFVKELEYDADSGQMVEYKRLRGTGIFRDPNDFSLLLTTGLFLGLYCVTDAKQGVFRLAWLGALVFFVYALALTHSRGGLLGALAGCLALFYARYGWRGSLFLGIPLVALGLAVFSGRMANLSVTEGTGNLRIQIWSDALDTLRSAPLLGAGLREFGALTGKVAHNSFLEAYAEVGLVGGTFFLGTFFCAVVGLHRCVRWREAVADPELRRLAPYLLAAVAAYGVGILSLSREEEVPTYLVLGMVAAYGSLAAVRVPALTLRLDSRLVQRVALASVAFLAVSYSFVRVFK